MTRKNGKNICLDWLICRSLTMGTGIWAMHFIGMLAYHLPVAIAYNLPLVIVSWLAAAIASGIVFYSLHRGFARRFSLLIPGILMGSGIGSMLYIGMAAMRVPAEMHNNYWIVALSFLVAVISKSIRKSDVRLDEIHFKGHGGMRVGSTPVRIGG
ncbi:MHYT domain-containing protein [Microcoleus sp. POL10_C6]|uniref:MHYT domain-containing protein n=1 Tax=unclassified Microcoleus TaxID=2642155 RepID=UPI002FD723DF